MNSLSYDKEGRGLFVERNAQFAFDRLFRGLGDTSVHELSSILDAVKEPASSLMKKASTADKTVLSNYLDSIREVEVAIQKQEQDGASRPHLEKVGSEVIQLDDFPSR